MEVELQDWIDRLTEQEEISSEDLDKIRERVDSIANQEDQSDLELNFLTAWFLAEMRAVENNVEKIDLSWAHLDD